VALDGEAEESLVHDVYAPSQRRFGDLDDLIARQRERAAGRECERQSASDRSSTPEECRPAVRDNSR
jgi:hypothetical protein